VAVAERFKGKSILVTGGGSGIGRAAATLFAAEGGRLTVVDRYEADAQETVARIERAGGEAVAVGADVSRSAACQAMVQRAVSAYGRLDIAFNNAGVGGSGFPLVEEEEIAFDEVLAVNLKGVFLSMKHEISAMLKTGGGTIVNTASVAGLIGEPGISSYSASKHGVVGLTRTAALDHIRQGIRINAVCPGATRTPLLEKWFQDPAVEGFVMNRHPIGRIGEPEEIARVVLFLASDESSFVVGQAWAVDGGLTAA
jgi:NAD(P)-dependent dehydrogenase (short-subunit alcohol dehydrogenase family)